MIGVGAIGMVYTLLAGLPYWLPLLGGRKKRGLAGDQESVHALYRRKFI